MPNLYIIAGPNGAGKTTSAKVLVPEFFRSNYFINADEIAKAIDPISPEKAAIQAGRLMLKQINELIKNKKDFVFETTLSAKTYVALVHEAKKLGYKVHLVFLYLQSAKLAQQRVKKRVKAGGHNIPEDVVERRYKGGLKNFFTLYQPIVNSWFFYNNTKETPELIAAKKDKDLIIYKKQFWAGVTEKYGN
jgi:predicted ABC-type ATPase